MSTNAEKSFEVRVLEVYDALVVCRLERDLLLAEVEQLRAALEQIAEQDASVDYADCEMRATAKRALLAVRG